MSIDSDEIVCRIPAADSGKRVLSFAHIEGTGSRAHIVINGKKYPPIYYDGYNKVANTWMLEKAKAGGCEIVRIGCSMHTMWKSENEFDFSIIDRYMDAFAVNYLGTEAVVWALQESMERRMAADLACCIEEDDISQKALLEYQLRIDAINDRFGLCE